MKSKSHTSLLSKKRIQVITSQNYGSVANANDNLGAFGASPSPPPVSPINNIQTLLHLSNIPRTSVTSRSSPVLTQTPTSAKLRGLYEATIASPYFRTLSPRVGSIHKVSDVSIVAPSSTGTLPVTEISPKQQTPKSIKSITSIDGETVRTPKLVGVWGAGFSIINLFLGLGLLSFPYALAQGSFVSLAVLALTCFLMSYTGKLIVRCFEGVPQDHRTYHQVGYIALDETFSLGTRRMKWGNFGMGLVSFGILCEFIGALCISTLFIWDNFSYLAPHLQDYWIVVISTLGVLPTCWMLNVSELAFNAFLGCVCKIFTVAVIVATFFANMSVTETESYDMVPTSPTHFSVSVGIFILSYAGHACLPEIYTSMKEPHRFERVLDICFVIMFFTYSGMALFGYLQFGRLTNVIITENLVSGESGANKTQLIVAKVLIGLVIASCYFQVSPILSVVANIPEDFCNIRRPVKKRIFRTFLFAVIIGLSWIVAKHLAILEAATGSVCTLITSVICPALFYFGLNHKTITWLEKIILFCYFIGGVAIGIYLLYNDIVAVITGQQ